MTVYGFDEQLQKGKAAEVLLDEFFGKWYRVEQVPLSIERRVHTDRLFVSPNGDQTLVEYKADYMGGSTGNVFIETASVDNGGWCVPLPGWALDCRADVLVYWIVGAGLVLCVKMSDVRPRIEEWRQRYRLAHCQNETYQSTGILVPIPVFKELAIFEGKLTDYSGKGVV